MDNMDRQLGELLWDACDEGNLERVKQLVEEGAPIDFQLGYRVGHLIKRAFTSFSTEQSTPIWIAAFRDHQNIVEFLLEEGANPFKKNISGKNALDASTNKMREFILENLCHTWRRFKIIILGDDRQGKTALYNALQGNVFSSQQSRINGAEIKTVDLKSWEPYKPSKHLDQGIKTFRAKKRRTPSRTVSHSLSYSGEILSSTMVKRIENAFSLDNSEKDENGTIFSCWDFVGQEEYYQMHQLFLSKYSIYLLVFDGSKLIDKNRLKYWLKSLKWINMTNEDITPSVALVISKIDDSNPRLLQRNQQIVRESCAQVGIDLENNIRRVSAKTGEGIQELKEKLEEFAECSPLFDEQKPLAWTAFLDDLKNKKKDMIPMSEAKKIAKENRIKEESFEEALNFFSELGFIVYFPYLKNCVIMNPQWVVDIVRRVITKFDISVVSRKFKLTESETFLLERGQITDTILQKLWQDFPESVADLKKIMIENHLAFENEFEGKLIVPSLVPRELSSDFSKIYDRVKNVEQYHKCRLHLAVVILGLTGTIAAKVASMTKMPPHIWRGGLAARWRETIIFVEMNEVTQVIDITTNASSPWGTFLGFVKNLISFFPPDAVSLEMTCPEMVKNWRTDFWLPLNFDDLNDGREIRCRKCKTHVIPSLELFDHVAVMGQESVSNEPKDIFISHSQKDSGLLARLLSDNFELNGYSTWLDRKAAEMLHDIPSIVRSCRMFLFIVSENSIKSKWCLLEVKTAIDARIPIVLLRNRKFRYGPVKEKEMPALEEFMTEFIHNGETFSIKDHIRELLLTLALPIEETMDLFDPLFADVMKKLSGVLPKQSPSKYNRSSMN